MEFNLITSPDDYRIEQIYHSYITTFPEDERREWTKFVQLFTQPNVEFFSVFNENENVGYLILWKLSQFTFVEHFEVFLEFRNQKLGSKIIDLLKESHSKIILEIEPEHLNEDSKRRFSFYQKNGFNLIDEMYIQPSYGYGKKRLQLWLLSNFRPSNLSEAKDEIYDIVYH